MKWVALSASTHPALGERIAFEGAGAAYRIECFLGGSRQWIAIATGAPGKVLGAFRSRAKAQAACRAHARGETRGDSARFVRRHVQRRRMAKR